MEQRASYSVGTARELFSIEAEQSVIGGLLMDNGAWDRIVGTLLPEHFYVGDNKRIFSAIGALISEKKSADIITVLERLKSRGELSLEGSQSPLAYLQELANSTASAVNIAHYAEIVRERALMRGLHATLASLQGMVTTANGLTAAQMVDAAQAQMLSLTQQGTDRAEARHISEFIDLAANEVDEASKKAATGGIVGLPTGLTDVDDMLSGIGATDLVVIAGRPSHGKSAFAINVCEYVSVHLKLPTVVFSLEMSSVQLTKRMLASQSGVNGLRLKDGRLSDTEWDRFARAQADMQSVPIFISDTPALTAAEISAQSRRLKRLTEGRLGLIVVDYLGLMNHGDENNRANSIERTTNALKNLAKELATPVMLLCQVNRGCEARTDKRPIMSDLRESGGIEQDADTVAFIYRDYLYHPEREDVRFQAEFIIRKQRSGPIGTVNLHYYAPRTRFGNLETR